MNQKSNPRKLPEQKTEPQNMPKSIFDMSTTPMAPKQDSSQLHSTGSLTRSGTGSVSETMTSGSKTVNSLYNQSQATGPILSSGKSEESNFKTSLKKSPEPIPEPVSEQVPEPVSVRPEPDRSEPKTDQHAMNEPKNRPDKNQENDSEKKSGRVLEPTELKSSFDKSSDKLEKMVTTVTLLYPFPSKSRLIVLK